MATCPTAEVVAALAAVLAADATYMALVEDRLYNDAPDDVEYPHTVLEYVADRPWHTFGGSSTGLGWDITVRAHTYSLYQGQSQALSISQRGIDLLNFGSLTVSGFTTVICERVMGRAMTESNKEKLETRHIVDEFRVRVHQ